MIIKEIRSQIICNSGHVRLKLPKQFPIPEVSRSFSRLWVACVLAGPRYVSLMIFTWFTIRFFLAKNLFVEMVVRNWRQRKTTKNRATPEATVALREHLWYQRLFMVASRWQKFRLTVKLSILTIQLLRKPTPTTPISIKPLARQDNKLWFKLNIIIMSFQSTPASIDNKTLGRHNDDHSGLRNYSIIPQIALSKSAVSQYLPNLGQNNFCFFVDFFDRKRVIFETYLKQWVLRKNGIAVVAAQFIHREPEKLLTVFQFKGPVFHFFSGVHPCVLHLVPSLERMVSAQCSLPERTSRLTWKCAKFGSGVISNWAVKRHFSFLLRQLRS